MNMRCGELCSRMGCVGLSWTEVRHAAEMPQSRIAESMQSNDDFEKLNRFDRHGRKN